MKLNQAPLIPAHAGIQGNKRRRSRPWIPAFAGMSGISIESISSEHALTVGKKDVDARNKCGHDGVGFAEERGREIKSLPAIERWADFRYIENSPVAQKPRAFSFRRVRFGPPAPLFQDRRQTGSSREQHAHE